MLVAGLATAVVVAGSATPAVAGDTSHWTTVTTGVTNTNRPGLERVGTALKVVWTQDTSPATLSARTYTPAGQPGAPVELVPASQGWDTLIHDPVAFGGQVALAGLRGIPTDSDYWDGPAFRVDDAGAMTGQLSLDNIAYVSQGQDATMMDGVPLFAFTDDFGKVLLHQGVLPDSDITVESAGCCVYQPGVRAATGGQAWLAWYSNSSAPDEQGWLVNSVSGLGGPAPVVGTRQQAPGALTGGSSLSPSQRAALARRPNGEVWFAYPIGYPTATKIRVWQLGTGVYRDIAVGRSLRHVAISADSAGRLWVAYAEADSNRVAVVRSNTTVSTFGHASTAKSPTDVIYGTAIDATTSRADIVMNDGSSLHHRQFLPALSVSGSVKITKKKKVKLKVQVRDAGAPVNGATATVKGVGSKTTGATGNATFTFPKSAKKKVKVTGNRTGYVPGSARVKLK